MSDGALVTVGGTNKLSDGPVDRVIGVLRSNCSGCYCLTGMSDVSVEGTLVVAVVTERPNISAGALVTIRMSLV